MNLTLELIILFLAGLVVGGQLNRAIYRLAWYSRPIGPWSAAHPDAAPRRVWDRVPVVGWWGLRRESGLHGRGYWIRPLVVELATGALFAGLYWWEVRGGLLPVMPGLVAPPPAHFVQQYVRHIVLISLMIAATFIDFDEKTIPDTITVPGTLLALLLAVLWPAGHLPVVVVVPPPMVHHLVVTTPSSWGFWDNGLGGPASWPSWLDQRAGLGLGLLAFLSWCAALSPRTWTTRRGWRKAFQYLAVSMSRHPLTWILAGVAAVGAPAIAGVWWWGGFAWQGLFSSLVGMAFGGGLIWAVRIIGTYALGKEAMGFGDVTLMAMIGAFLGWQPALIIFFLAPFAALLISVAQLILTGRKDIAFGPYLCAAALALIVAWGQLWQPWAEGIFLLGWFIPAMVGVCLMLMAGLLSLWRVVEDWWLGEEVAGTAPDSTVSESTVSESAAPGDSASDDPMSSNPMSNNPMSSDPMSSDPLSDEPTPNEPMSTESTSGGLSGESGDAERLAGELPEDSEPEDSEREDSAREDSKRRYGEGRDES